MKFHIHQPHIQVADFFSVFQYLKEIVSRDNSGIHIFPELFLTGYPLQDLCLQKPFITNYQLLLNNISEELPQHINNDTEYLFGGIHYTLTENGIPKTIENVVLRLNKNGLMPVYTKQLLPNYDIFDEQKYFTKGNSPAVLRLNNKNIGILICEDMWSSNFHKIDPVKKLLNHCKINEIQLDAIVNLSASPWHVDKYEKRVNKSKFISRLSKCPFVYVNRVGGEDEIQFDGQSYICDGNKTLLKLDMFSQDSKTLNIDKNTLDFSGEIFRKQCAHLGGPVSISHRN